MKKIISVLLAVVMLMGVLSLCACSNTKDDNVITIWQISDDSDYWSDYNEHPLTLYIEEKFDIDLQYQIPAAGSEQENFNLMMGTGDYTDVIDLSYCQDTTTTLYDEGVIYDLTDYIAEYMPNYSALLEEYPEYKAAISSDDGKIFNLIPWSPIDQELMWGGLMYRRDILDTMTGGNVAFPSGEEEPTTIEDWEYMLDLMYQYFNAAGMTDYACLILPYNGTFYGGELISGFGIGGPAQYQIDGTVYYGAQQEGYLNYCAKMNEWFEKGWIYQDFATRVNDVFYLPNTSLTFGAAAGIWYGIAGAQAGEVMSMPEYGLNVYVEPLKTPLDTEHGITEQHALLTWTNFSQNSGFAVTTNCSEEKLIKYLTAMDYFYGEEGSLIVSYGLGSDLAADNEFMNTVGLSEGCWWYDENGEIVMNPRVIGNEKEFDLGDFQGTRFPGLKQQEATNAQSSDAILKCNETWTACGRDWNYPAEVTLTTEQSKTINSISQDITDCVNKYTVGFITGTIELNDDNWAQFQTELENLGIDTYIGIYQDALDAYNAKMAA